jgi:hypothetical protein
VKGYLPASGDLLTLIQPGRQFARSLTRRHLDITCRFRNQVADRHRANLMIVFEAVNGEKEFGIPVDSRITAMRNTFGLGFEFDVPVPAAAPAGPYHVFLRASMDDTKIGDGFGFDVDLLAGVASEK